MTLAEARTLEAGWHDEYPSVPPDPDVLQQAEQLLVGLPEPAVYPFCDGGMSLMWDGVMVFVDRGTTLFDVGTKEFGEHSKFYPGVSLERARELVMESRGCMK